MVEEIECFKTIMKFIDVCVVSANKAGWILNKSEPSWNLGIIKEASWADQRIRAFSITFITDSLVIFHINFL